MIAFSFELCIFLLVSGLCVFLTELVLRFTLTCPAGWCSAILLHSHLIWSPSSWLGPLDWGKRVYWAAERWLVRCCLKSCFSGCRLLLSHQPPSVWCQLCSWCSPPSLLAAAHSCPALLPWFPHLWGMIFKQRVIKKHTSANLKDWTEEVATL